MSVPSLAEIESLFAKGCIKQVTNPTYVVNPLTVSKNSKGKMRPILDLRKVNPRLYKFGVRYENFEELENYIEPNSFLRKFGLNTVRN